MKQGVTGFVPERLEEALEARNVTQVSLSQLSGTSPTSVSRWLKGEQTPEASALAALASALNLPTSYFLKAMEDHGQAPFFFRSMASATKGARNKAKARMRWGQQISIALQDVVDLPDCNVPDLADFKDFRTLEDERIEEIAQQCRRAWGLGDGPISDLHLLLENNGVVTIHDALEAATMDGVSSWSNLDGRAYVYVAIDKPSAVRVRFNAAHELGHLILHRNVDKSTLVKKEEFNLIERQAHLFAAALLLPANSFAGELHSPTLAGFQAMKERWKVSIGAMIVRCSTLGIIDDDYKLRLWKHYSAKGWRSGEPLDDVIPYEHPRLLARSIMILAEQGGWSLSEILETLPLSAGDIESLTSLPVGYLSNNRENIVEMPKLKDSAVRSAGGATIFEFPKRGN